MKKIVFILFLIAVLGALVAVPIINANSKDDSDVINYAEFKFTGDLQTEYGTALPINIKVPKGVSKIELIYNDSIFQTFNNPKSEITFPFMAYYFGLGTRVLVLKSYLSDKTTREDARNIRVVSDFAPKPFKTTIKNSFPHNTESYTQGLEFNNGQLYESTGDPGQQGKSIVAKVALKTGEQSLKNGLDATYFGEGITILGDELFQLTWQNGKCFVYDKNTLQLKEEFTYTGQGWGLCNDGKNLIMSDGTERITIRDPKTFRVIRTIEVYDNVGSRPNLNELEWINGKIYANVYTTTTIIGIDPKTGAVVEEIDASELLVQGKNGGDVLNGIAYNSATKQLFMTGKYWTKLFEVELTEIK